MRPPHPPVAARPATGGAGFRAGGSGPARRRYRSGRPAAARAGRPLRRRPRYCARDTGPDAGPRAPAVGEGVPDDRVADPRTEPGLGIGERQDVHVPARCADGPQAPHVGGPGLRIVAEYVEQGTVDDGVEGTEIARFAIGDGQHVDHLEPCVRHALGGGVAPGVVDRARRQVDAQHVIAQFRQQNGVFTGTGAGVEHPAADRAGALEVDDRRLRLADHPGSGVVVVDGVPEFRGSCHGLQRALSTTVEVNGGGVARTEAGSGRRLGW